MRLRFTRSALLHWLDARRAGVRCFSSDRVAPPERADCRSVHRQKATQLVRAGFAYPCYCSDQELVAMRERQRAHGQTDRYDRRCLSLYAEHRADYEAAGRRPAIRFRVPEGLVIAFEDMLRGPMRLESDRLDDFLILDREGRATGVLATVLSRAEAGVTHVVRGEAQALDTARELLLYEALGLATPRYAHLRWVDAPPRSRRANACRTWTGSRERGPGPS